MAGLFWPWSIWKAKPLGTASTEDRCPSTLSSISASRSSTHWMRPTPRASCIDIKPANIFITKNRQAKLLDFGLAKVDTRRDLNATADAETMKDLTSPGSALGTVAYMSPEQARGEELDGRTDLFSLGATLYEMTSGKQAFEGNTSAVIFESILNRNPVPLHQLNPDLPPEFERILDRSLEKDRDLRYQSAAEMRAEMKILKRTLDSQRTAAAHGPSASSTGTAVAPPAIPAPVA